MNSVCVKGFIKLVACDSGHCVWMMLSVQQVVIAAFILPRYHGFDWLLRTDLPQRKKLEVL